LDTENYDLDIVSHTSVPGFDWGGLGFVGGKGTWLQSYGAGVAAHELGHNYGLMHGNFWDTTTNGATGIGPGFSVEYGNSFDTMGAAAAGANHFGAMFKNSLGWLPDSAVHSIASNGVYRIYAFDTPQRTNERLYAAKVHKDYGRDYWLEFRHEFPGNVSLQNGLLLNWSPWSYSSGGTDLLDTTPGTLTKADAALVIGRTFSDVPAGVHLTPVARGTTGTDPWIDVQVNLGTFPGDWPPFLEVEMDPTNAGPGVLVHFHATATDLDGDTLAYAWSFDDGSFSTNNLPWTFHAWGTPGEHVVRCVVSDMKGGIASANTIVPVGKPTGFRLSGIILDANDDPIEGVRVDNGITNTTGYVCSYTDSDGGFVLTGLTGEITLEATKYGYTFTNATWENPIQVSSNLLHVDFLAQPITWVSLWASTNQVNESSKKVNQLVLTRTGSTNDDLAVNLYASGTARVDKDLSFKPPLTVGWNQVVIPAGTNRIVFDFTPVNDSIVEAAEVASVTIAEDPAFYIAPLAEVRITVLDDDQPSLPGVSVSIANPFIPENGVDDFLFVFSRTGKPTGELP
ncbi:MAG: PKD domain-containing protein, partial [Verrucomicrobia bacterium]|nr:PKD domain-containing protein [Verrucomicrobiota bacterium]